jgi:hypothetical protein
MLLLSIASKYELFMTSDETTSISVFVAIGYLFQKLKEAGQTIHISTHVYIHTYTEQDDIISQLSYVKQVNFAKRDVTHEVTRTVGLSPVVYCDKKSANRWRNIVKEMTCEQAGPIFTLNYSEINVNVYCQYLVY